MEVDMLGTGTVAGSSSSSGTRNGKVSTSCQNHILNSPEELAIKNGRENEPVPGNEGGIYEDIEVRMVDLSVGRGIFAKRDFLKGEIVFTDTPIVSCQYAWNQMYSYKACEYCLRALETAEENARRLAGKPDLELPHPECCETKKELQVSCDGCQVAYCSAECKERAWIEYHSVICTKSSDSDLPETHPLKVLDLYWRMMHYPPETASIFIVVKLLARLHLDSSGLLRKRLSEFCSSSLSENEELSHKMLGEEHLTRIINLREMVKNVINFDNIQDYLTPEKFLALFLLIARNGQGVGTSSFAAWVENIEKLETIDEEEKKTLLKLIDDIYGAMDGHVGHFLDNEGTALYPMQSWVNHSCVANTEVRFPYRNHEVALVACRNIQMGDEITISYLDLGDLSRSRYSRNKYLKEHYLFVCNCPKCIDQADEPDISSEEEEDEEDDDEMEDDLGEGEVEGDENETIMTAV